MKTLSTLCALIVALAALQGCSQKQVSSGLVETDLQAARVDFWECEDDMQKAHTEVRLALEYDREGGFSQAAQHFLNAADLVESCGNDLFLRNCLIAASKEYLKCSERRNFLKVMGRFAATHEAGQYPDDDVRLLVNIQCALEQRPLAYPIRAEWGPVFR